MNNSLENKTIFLKDNLLNIVHDLSQSNYSFDVSGIVEDNTRFELFFRNNSLSNEEELFANNSIKVFPNPSNSLVYFEITNSTIIKEIVVYDINGKLINKYTGSHQSIDISKYANGVYLFKIKTNNGSVNKKIMKK